MVASQLCLLRNIYNLSCKRSIFTCQVYSKFQKPYGDSASKSEIRLRLEDKLPERYRLVYKAPLIPYIYAANITSVGSLASFGAFTSWKLYATMGIQGLPFSSVLYEEISEFSKLEVGTFLGGFLLTNLALWAISSRYALRIYSDEQEKSPRYCLVMVGLLPMSKRKIEFSVGEMKPAHSSLPWRENYFHLGSNGLLLFPHYFRTPSDYHAMFIKTD